MAKKRKVPPAISAYMAQISGKGKGGRARAEKLSPERLSEIAKKAAAARWGGKKAAPTRSALPDAATALPGSRSGRAARSRWR